MEGIEGENVVDMNQLPDILKRFRNFVYVQVRRLFSLKHWRYRLHRTFKLGRIRSFLLSSWTYLHELFTRAPEKEIAAYLGRSERRIKVLHVNAYLSKGGASRAASMLHCTLLAHGIESVMVTRETPIISDNILPTCRKSLGSYLLECFAWIRYLLLTKSLNKPTIRHSPQIVSSYSLLKTIELLEPEIVHLHWICGDYITIEEIGRIGVPVVWTMHDMWPILAEDHVDYGDVHREDYSDLSINTREGWTWKRKQRSFQELASLTCVGVSRYMRDLIKESVLFREREVVNFPNPIQRELFHRCIPRDEEPPVIPAEHKGRFVLLFVSAYIDYNKGIDLLDEALCDPTLAHWLDRLLLLTVGPVAGFAFQNKITRHDLGVVKDDNRMAQIYSAAHMTLVTSRFESYSLAAAESICCGTPVVSFDTSGLRDVVENGVTGWRAQCFDSSDFATKITDLLGRLENGSIADYDAWEKACERFSPESVAVGYENLYEAILSK